MNKKVVGYHISGKIDVKELRDKSVYEVVSDDGTEILFKTEAGGLLYVFNYGSVVFLGINEQEQMTILDTLRKLLNIPDGNCQKEEFEVETNANRECAVMFNKIIIDGFNNDYAKKIIMLNIAQSVALDYYSIQSEKLLEETRTHTTRLEKTGKFRLRGRKLLKYMGRVLNLKNRIAENLYIFESPGIVWDNQKLTVVNAGLNRELEIGVRYKSVGENLNIVKENLDLFRDVSQHAHSSVLEWIVILLILVEVVHLVIGWIF